jgi:hypothetical protein
MRLFDILMRRVPSSELYYGALATTTRYAGQAAGIPGNTSAGYMPAAPYVIGRHTHTHEIGHSLGRQHDVNGTLFGTVTNGAGTVFAPGACGEIGLAAAVYPLFQPVPPPGGANKPALGPMTNGFPAMIYGLDTLTLRTSAINPVVDPNTYFDVMSYCSSAPLDLWISSYTYGALRTAINARFGVGGPGPAPGGRAFNPARGGLRPAAPNAAGDWIFIRGLVDFAADTAQFQPFVTVSLADAPDAPPVGEYIIVMLDANGNILSQAPFQPDQSVVEDDDQANVGSFIVPAPANPALHQVQLFHLTKLVATITAGASVPAVSSVALTSTNGASYPGTGPLVITWAASDSDPAAQLTYALQYSPDGGATWQTLVVDWPDTAFQVDSSELPASSQGLIRVIVTDGFNTGAPFNSAPFNVQSQPPTVNIDSPQNDSVFTVDQQLVLAATVNDPQDGFLDGASVQWADDLAGPLGSGDSLYLEADALIEGRHLITVTATDSLGLANSASVEIIVLADPQPALALEIVGGQVRVSWPATTVTNFVLETSVDLSSGVWTPVTSEPVIVDDQQVVILDAADAVRYYRLRLP